MRTSQRRAVITPDALINDLVPFAAIGQDAHKRVMSVAALQQHLHASGHGEAIAVGPYLSKLCGTLAQSMIGESRPVALEIKVNGGSVVSSEAVSLGLIVIESVINALKHAFPQNKNDGRIVVAYDTSGAGWTLSIADNGVVKPLAGAADAKSGLGTSIVQALANELDAKVEFSSDQYGSSCEGEAREVILAAGYSP
jgi:chemotaxis protein methyltransferase CheR